MQEATIGTESHPINQPAMPDLNDLYLFALVAKQGSFTAAGKAAGLTTSRISRRIAGLEERLGVRLLHRTTRKLALTAIGELYYQHCQAMVSEAEAAAEVVEQIQASPRGRVRISCPAITAQSVLGAVIIEFMQRYPEVRVALTATDRFVDLIDEGVDVAIRFRASAMEDSSLVARALGESHIYLVTSPTCLDKNGRPAQPADLLHLTSLGKRRHDADYSWSLTSTQGQSSVIAYQPLFESDDWQVLKQAALAGLGVVAMPSTLCKLEIMAGTLEIVLPEWRLPSATLHVIYTSRRGLIPAVRAFIDFASERLAETCLTVAQET